MPIGLKAGNKMKQDESEDNRVAGVVGNRQPEVTANTQLMPLLSTECMLFC